MSHKIHRVCIMPTTEFLAKGIETWSKNRPADMLRVKELKEYMKEHRRCPGVISIAMLGDRFVCYDGNHRRLALGPYVAHVVVDTMYNATEDEIMKEFVNINKSIGVPAIYIEELSTKEEIELFVTSFVKKYASLVSPSGACKKPNFNRDKLIQNIVDLHELYEGDIKMLFNNIHELNKQYQQGKYIKKGKMTVNTHEKCTASGLWLFAEGRSINEGHLKRVCDSL